ncbi:glycosyl hydrolase [Cupriavidus necator]|nr:glycosyl hydrolase [Cupriavidus necator]
MPCDARFDTLNRPAQPAAGVRARAAQRGLVFGVRRAVLFLAVRAVRGATLQP